MTYKYVLLDVFADAPFQGTQIPVVILEQSLSSKERQLIASEFQQTETVFIDNTGSDNPFSVFNSSKQAVFGAHTTLAAAYIAHELGLTKDQGAYSSYDLQQDSQRTQCFIDKTSEGVGSIQFARELAPTIDRFTPSASRIAKALNIDEKHIGFSRYRPMVVSIGTPTLIVGLTSEEHVLDARLNVGAWAELLAETYATEIFLFAPKSDQSGANFHGRLINPNIAYNTYPPIGNVLPEFISFLAEQTDVAIGTHTFTIDRGSEATRKSVLHVEFDKRKGKLTQCRIGGSVVKMATGEMLAHNLAVA